MSGRKTKEISDYIFKVAKEAAAGEDENRKIEETKKAEGTVASLIRALRPGRDNPIVGEFYVGEERTHVIGYVATDILRVDGNGCLGVKFAPGNVVISDGIPRFRKGTTVVPLGSKAVSLRGMSSNTPAYMHVMDGTSSASFYVAPDVIGKVMRAEFGYAGNMPERITQTFAQRLNGRR